MKYEYTVPMKLPAYPNPFKVRSTEGEKLSLIVGLLFIAAGVAFFLGEEIIAAAVFGGIGLIFSFIYIAGLIGFYAGVKKNKDTFFDFIRDAVKNETGITMSYATIASMWNEGSHKAGSHKFVAAGRKGKEFSVSIY